MIRTNDFDSFTISPHAAARIRQMDLSSREVADALCCPEIEYPGRPGHEGRPTRVAVRGRLAVVRSVDGVVITVLWHGAESRFAA